MRAVVLLFFCCLARAQEQNGKEANAQISRQVSFQLDTYTMLRDLASTVTELLLKQSSTQEELNAMQTKLQSTERKVEELRHAGDETKVAFSASVTKSDELYVGPYAAETTVVYTNIFTNVGNAYSPVTGIFAAPVRGVYEFTIYIFGANKCYMGVSINKNAQRVVTAYMDQTNSFRGTAANGVTLQLEAGDQVYARLWANHCIYDSVNHHSTFSGSLVFPL